MACHHFPSCSQQAWEQLIEDIERGGAFSSWRIAWFQKSTSSFLSLSQPPRDLDTGPWRWHIGNHEVPLYCKGCCVWFFKTSSQWRTSWRLFFAMTGTNSEIWAGPYGGSLGFFTERILLQYCYFLFSWFYHTNITGSCFSKDIWHYLAFVCFCWDVIWIYVSWLSLGLFFEFLVLAAPPVTRSTNVWLQVAAVEFP